MRVFISQPMRGKTNEEILYNMNEVKKALKSVYDDVEIIESYNPDFYCKNVPLACLGNAITQLATADLAYFTKGWQDARGCRIECLCALEYGIKTIFEEDICQDFTKE